jgi:RNA polymerase sigma-70 factor (ECF subfamily)
MTLLSGLGRRYAGVQARPVRLAGGDGFVLELCATVIGVVGIEIAGGRVTELNLVVDPAKLPRST